MFKWNDYLNDFTDIYLLDDTNLLEVNIQWLNCMLSVHRKKDIKKLSSVVLEIIRVFDSSKEDHHDIIFRGLRKFFINNKFLEKVLNSRDRVETNYVENADTFIQLVVTNFLDPYTVSFFRYHRYFSKLPGSTKELIREFEINLAMEDRHRLEFSSTKINRAMDNKLSYELILFLRYKYPDEIIPKARIKWSIEDSDHYTLSLVNLNDRNLKDEPLNYIMMKILECKSSKSRFVVISLSFTVKLKKEDRTSKHRNMIIYDKVKNTVERFEPWGNLTSEKFCIHFIDSLLLYYFKQRGVKYVKPYNNNPVLGLQRIQCDNERKYLFDGEPGRCIAWSVWYADHRLRFPDFSQTKIVNSLLNNIKGGNQKLTDYIRSYMFRVDLFDKIVRMPNEEVIERILDWEILDNNLSISSFINFYGLVLFLILPLSYKNSFVDDKELVLYVKGVPLMITNLNSYVSNPNTKSYLKSIPDIKFTYGKKSRNKTINLENLVKMIKKGYKVDYLEVGCNIGDLSDDTELKSRKVRRYIKYIVAILKKYGLDKNIDLFNG